MPGILALNNNQKHCFSTLHFLLSFFFPLFSFAGMPTSWNILGVTSYVLVIQLSPTATMVDTKEKQLKMRVAKLGCQALFYVMIFFCFHVSFILTPFSLCSFCTKKEHNPMKYMSLPSWTLTCLFSMHEEISIIASWQHSVTVYFFCVFVCVLLFFWA